LIQIHNGASIGIKISAGNAFIVSMSLQEFGYTIDANSLHQEHYADRGCHEGSTAFYATLRNLRAIAPTAMYSTRT